MNNSRRWKKKRGSIVIPEKKKLSKGILNTYEIFSCVAYPRECEFG